MTVYVDGFDYSQRLDNLLDVVHRIANPVLNKIYESLPEDQKTYFQKNRTSEVLTPDGNDWEKPTGVISFYTSGFVKSAAEKIIRGIIRVLKAKGFDVGPLKGEQSGMFKSYVVRIPITKNPYTDYKGPDEIQWSNRNAYHIFKNILGLEPTDEHGASFEFGAQEIIDRVKMITQHDPKWLKHSEIKPTDTQMEPTQPGDEWKEEPVEPSDNPHDDIAKSIGKGMGARFIDMGLNEPEMLRRLTELVKLAKWALQHGFEKMVVY